MVGKKVILGSFLIFSAMISFGCSEDQPIEVTTEQSIFELYNQNPTAFYNMKLRDAGALIAIESSFRYHLENNQKFSDEVWNVQYFQEYDEASSKAISDEILEDFLAILSANGDLEIVEKKENQIVSIRFLNKTILQNYFSKNSMSNEGTFSIPIFELGEYINESLEATNNNDSRALCRNSSTIKAKITPSSEYGRLFLANRKTTKIYGCPISWDGDLTQFRYLHAKVVGFQ